MKNTVRFIGIVVMILASMVSHLSAQTPLNEAPRKADVSPAWPDCDPKLPDCTKSRMADFIAANLQIPPEAKSQSAGGVVVMEFVVEKNGTIGEVRSLHDPGFGLGAEATRVINLMKTKKIKWTPAEEDGKKIAFRYVTPVSFNLTMPPAEKSKATETGKVLPGHIYDIAEVMPRYAGCDPANTDSLDCTFMKVVSHIKSNIKYPEEALKGRIQGQVVIDFVIDSAGLITSPIVSQGLGFGCDQEALRVLDLMPAWTPGMQDGKPVAVRMKIPFFFQLPKEKE
jgi:TonB family protein